MNTAKLFILLIITIFSSPQQSYGADKNTTQSPADLSRIEGVYIHLVEDLEGDVMSHMICIYPSFRFDNDDHVLIHYRVISIIRPSMAADPKIEVLPTLYFNKNALEDGLGVTRIRFIKKKNGCIEFENKTYIKQVMKPEQ